jgi:glycosyltransferase involved in cell wall biosynthesis
MILAFDVSYIQRERTGLGRYATELLEALLRVEGDNQYKLHGWSSSLDHHWLRGVRNANVSLHCSSIPGAVKRIYWNRLRFPPLERFIGEFDVFQSIDPFLPPTKGKKTIATVHDVGAIRFPQWFEKNVLRWNRYIEHSLRSATAVIVPSLSTKADVMEYYQIGIERLAVIRPPVNPIFRPVHSTEHDSSVRIKHGLLSPFVLFVGTLEPRKNIVALLKAFELFRRRGQFDLDLVVVGRRGWMFQEILETIKNSPVRQSIHYLDFISDEELAGLYRICEFFVYPSHYEGHGSPVVEAMASGKAVITSNTSSLKEIAEGSALLVDPHSLEELAQAMHSLLEDSELRNRLCQLGLRNARRFSHESAANALLELYRSLV